MIEHDTLFVDGAQRSPAGADTITVIGAATGEVIGRTPAAGEADVDAAVAAARRALTDKAGWAGWDPGRRADLLDRLADEVEARGSEAAALVAQQNGMPITTALAVEAAIPVAVYRYYADLARNTEFSEVRPGLLGGSARVDRLPVGVIGAIVPWNYPNLLTAFKVAPALAAGCAVVIKPGPETVLDTYLFADAVSAASVPPGVISIVPGAADIGRYLVGHPGVDKVTFTGSTEVGRQIGASCGQLLRPVTLELGGKSAAILLDDVDLAVNADGLFQATLLNNGQTCVANTRILAPRGRYAEAVDFFAELCRSAAVGDPLDPGTLVGPMVTEAHRARVERYIARGVADGARLVSGGGRPQRLDRGWFVQPTVFADVDPGSVIAREEIFGPVLSVLPYDSVDEAIALANASDYGLAGTVWTADPDSARPVADAIDSGTFGINYFMLDPVAPFGGTKASGLGRELGPEGLAACLKSKTTHSLV
ncbi:acyl-CoA reductase-like NAD-dependent aldehyde dehydrogenase [Rhodococcus wratislaviensis]|uniref:aldehyde dehydrogenase (NAD(+)) n=1 Tax=Rhodococcus wratislaviensis TaxID=44752 RepID=A0AB38F8E7_RHOWR|nr:aldehyde dehydrogenase [Rhodococcus wratislaviensis]REE73096.1 acyl-CoA reductase-like NAD-dependent aldehyde dehydrogenase [Rhodococcus wratislaviensis]SPZ37886.1 aldehyde dehydrogenase [Rhodococcus wratislaviensis]